LRLPVVGRERSALSVCEEKACVPAKNNILVHVSNVLSSITAFYGGKVISLQRYKKKEENQKMSLHCQPALMENIAWHCSRT
jgi:hypothetical protein